MRLWAQPAQPGFVTGKETQPFPLGDIALQPKERLRFSYIPIKIIFF